MKVVIVEDEKIAAQRLELLLKEYDKDVEVAAMLDSVEDTVLYLKTKSHPDVLLLDIHLSDGHSFEIFQQYNYTGPVIFTTAYDEYALEAFKHSSIDYILKPVTLEALAAAFQKMKTLAASFSGHEVHNLVPDSIPQLPAYKSRFIGKIGQRLFVVCVNTVSFFEADNRIVHLTDREGHRYLVDYTMEKLEEQLDPNQFFRLNRSVIAHIDAVEQIKPFFNKRLRVFLKGAPADTEIVISRERVAEFKEWANG